MDEQVAWFNSQAYEGLGPISDEKLPADCICLAFVDISEYYDSSFAILAKNDDGYWAGEGGGCSCYCDTTVVGPCATQDEALASLSQGWREELLYELERAG